MIAQQITELKNTEQKLAELREQRVKQAATVDNLQEQYIAGALSLDKLQTAQTKLATFDDLIKSLDAKRTETADKVAINRRAQDAEQRLAALDAIDTAAADARLRYLKAFDEMDALMAERMPGLLEVFGEYINTARGFTDGATTPLEYRTLCDEVHAYRKAHGRNEPIICQLYGHVAFPNAPHGFADAIEQALDVQRMKPKARKMIGS